MSFSDYLELELLDHVFGAASYSAPATLYFGLSTATITDSTTGTTVTEPSGNAYARKSETNNSTLFPAASAGQKKNGTAITFAQATGSWGTITDFFIADAATLGNILAYGTLTTSKAIGNGDTASFAANDLTITLD